MTAAAWTNWSGSVAASGAILRPRDETELARGLASAKGPVRPIGSGHSFTPLCETSGTLVDLSALPTGVIRASAETGEAEVWAGTPIWALGPALHAHGLALPNQGDIDRQTLAGAMGTGTHGTGLTLGAIPTFVTGLTLVTAAGRILDVDARNEAEVSESARLSLGSMGVVSRVRLKLARSYGLSERSYTLAAEEGLRRLEELAGSHRHFEFFWFPYADRLVVKTLDMAEAGGRVAHDADAMRARGLRRSGEERLFEAACRVVRRVPRLSAPLHRRFTASMAASETRPGRVRWSFETFPSARTVRFNEMEYSVPRERAADAIRAVVDRIRRDRLPTAFPIEFRFVKGDDVWLSPFFGRDSATISVHQHRLMDPGPLFRACEDVLRGFEGRPHWGKMHALTADDLSALYPRFADFNRVRAKLDPDGRFESSYIRRILGSVRG